MRSKDIELMNKIKRFAEDFYIKEKYSPSTTVIAKKTLVQQEVRYTDIWLR